jgi:hypothetical protein
LNTGDFKDNDTVVAGRAGSSNTLRSQDSSFGSDLSIVQIHRGFQVPAPGAGRSIFIGEKKSPRIASNEKFSARF